MLCLKIMLHLDYAFKKLTVLWQSMQTIMIKSYLYIIFLNIVKIVQEVYGYNYRDETNDVDDNASLGKSFKYIKIQ